MNASARLLRWLPACLTALLLLSAAGCASVHLPKPAPKASHLIHDLSEHVDFLTQPGLKGRKCRSIESGYVRKYLRQQFEAIGLTPWGKTSGFDQWFGFGTNVVGVLKGSDPQLADQVVLVCAHYDGAGAQNGKVYPGAADDAAGVAVLLQTAERLAAKRQGLRRSVAFAALDCGDERYFGAFAFTMRKDFDPSVVTAVIDLDMLGRENFDVVANTLIVVGANEYPGIRQSVRRAAQRAMGGTATRSPTSGPSTQDAASVPFRLLEGGGDLLPPISDYFAFEQWRLPALLFTNGLYSDYHKPTDTADKLNYDLLQRDANVAVQVVRDIASHPARPTYVKMTAGDREELRGILTTLEEVLAHAEKLTLTPLERGRMGQLAQRARQLLAKDNYSLADRKAFSIELVEKGAPSILRFFYAPPKPDPSRLINGRQMAAALAWYEFFAAHRPFAAQATQQVMRHFIDARGNLLRLLSAYTVSSCDIRGDEIIHAKQKDDQHRLSFIYPHLKIQAGIAARDFDVEYAAADMRGMEGEIVDACLLYWSTGDDACMAKVMPAVLAAATGRAEGQHYKNWLKWRLEEVGAADEAAWERDLWQAQNADVTKLLLKKAASKKANVPEETLRRIITDREMRADVRVDAITALPSPASKESLLALVDVLSDATVVQTRYCVPAFDPTFPFFGHVGMREARFRPVIQPAATVGMAAHNRLKTLTGQDFRGDVNAWREWVMALRG